MGLENEIDVTDDIGMADAILASSSELEQNPWIQGVAKFYKLPIFVIKVSVLSIESNICRQYSIPSFSFASFGGKIVDDDIDSIGPRSPRGMANSMEKVMKHEINFSCL